MRIGKDYLLSFIQKFTFCVPAQFRDLGVLVEAGCLLGWLAHTQQVVRYTFLLSWFSLTLST